MVIAGVLWGTVGPSARFIDDHMNASPVDLATYRGALATLGLFALVRRLPRLERRTDWGRATLVGVALTGTQLCYFQAVQIAGVTVATLVTFGLSPVFVAAGERFVLKAAPQREVLAALITSIAGLVLLVGGGTPNAGAPIAALGGLLYASATLASRSMASRAPSADLNLAVSVASTAVLVPVVCIQGLAVPDNAEATVGILYFGLAATLAFGLHLAALRRVTATESAIVALLEPLTAAVLAAVLFAERLSPTALLGAAFMLGSIAALFRPARTERVETTLEPEARSSSP